VVVDSPPILLTSEARVLASLFGQIVMVVRAAGTPKQAVLDAIKLIGEGLKVSLVLNQAVHASDGDSYYGYGYKYGYGYGESPNNDSQT
jgi:receptor protein-tyrosine kinase